VLARPLPHLEGAARAHCGERVPRRGCRQQALLPGLSSSRTEARRSAVSPELATPRSHLAHDGQSAAERVHGLATDSLGGAPGTCRVPVRTWTLRSTAAVGPRSNWDNPPRVGKARPSEQLSRHAPCVYVLESAVSTHTGTAVDQGSRCRQAVTLGYLLWSGSRDRSGPV
jgi:hypothetical protein